MLNSYIDLRSDTVTQPTAEMKAAMVQAPLGDDVLGDDPTIHELEVKIAARLKKESALFVPTGTMSNQIAIKAQTEPGQSVLCEMTSHIFRYESGGPAFLSGVQLIPILGKDGVLDLNVLEEFCFGSDLHHPPTRMVCLENTHNFAGGTVVPIAAMKELCDWAKSKGFWVHLDGARLFNASVASQIGIEEYARWADTISICFSKGLGAPVGSALIGSQDTIQRARRFRKLFGGGMRQSGILAAGALYALDHHVERLKQDHDLAKWLAEGIHTLPGLKVDITSVQTNMVVVTFPNSKIQIDKILTSLKERKILCLPRSKTQIRMVTHLHIDQNDIQRTIDAFKELSSLL